MKYRNTIRLLAVLLCALLLLTACSSEDPIPTDPEAGVDTSLESETEAETEAPLLGPVEPLLKNFFTYTSVNPWKVLKDASRLKGELVTASQGNGIIVLRNSSVNTMNQATEVFTVHNTQLGKTVLTLTNTYTYRADYTAFDWSDLCVQDETVIYPEREMKVSVVDLGIYSLIEVAKATVTPINRDTEDSDGDLYDIVTLYEYYDASGTKIAESAKQATPTLIGISHEGIAVTLAGVNLVLDAETGAAISVTDADGGIRRLSYDDENERYGYYLAQIQLGALGSTRSFLEVYRKEDSVRVLRYYPEECDVSRAFVLQNGDLLVQCRSVVDEDSGRAYNMIENGQRTVLKTYLVDVPTGDATEISCNYLIMDLCDREEFSELCALESNGIYATENAVNICKAIPIDAQPLQDVGTTDPKIVVLNNDGSEMFVCEPIVPEHAVSNSFDQSAMGFSILPNGDYLVRLGSDLDSPRAIVSADNKRVRAYLYPYARIAGEYVVLPEGIFDYDLNCLYRFDLNDLRPVRVIGNRILVESTAPYATGGYQEIYRQDGSFYLRDVFDGKDVSIVSMTADYLIVQNQETQKQSLYNVNLEHILTTQSEMMVANWDDQYIISTVIRNGGKAVTVFYTLGEEAGA
ncbi:MAG: hypothetical protein IKA76_08565 [Clostridia bacterium]|nr:hypothetical protein [Clostridia bacterium]